ncbi:MAG: hypothetical protein JSS02_35110 [Planctomycetes bacterium]|nr:hypothetical protein [Planctomycetota bacterium]
MATLPVESAELLTDQPPRARRRRLMSVRIFLGLLALFAIGSGWVVLRGYRQLAAIQAIEKLGGSVEQDPVGLPWLRRLLGEDQMRMFDEVISVSVSADAGLQHLRGFTTVKTLHLYVPQVTDAGLRHLRGLTSLKSLSIYGLSRKDAKVTDAGLQYLSALTGLESLSLERTQVTDAGIPHLRGLTMLKCLNLDGTQVTDTGLQHLRALTAMEWLSLEHTRVTDLGLQHLRGVTALKWLYLCDTKVTDIAVTDLENALPGLKFHRKRRHLTDPRTTAFQVTP